MIENGKEIRIWEDPWIPYISGYIPSRDKNGASNGNIHKLYDLSLLIDGGIRIY